MAELQSPFLAYTGLPVQSPAFPIKGATVEGMRKTKAGESLPVIVDFTFLLAYVSQRSELVMQQELPLLFKKKKKICHREPKLGPRK